MNTKKKTREQGSILVIAMVILLLLSGLGVAYMTMTSEYSKQTVHSMDYQTATEAAWAGLDMAKVIMVLGHDSDSVITATPWTHDDSVSAAIGWDDELQACNVNMQNLVLSAAPENIGPGDIINDVTNFRIARLLNYRGTTFGVAVEDNDDGDSNLLTDSDDLVIISVVAGLIDINGSVTDIQHSFRSVIQAICRYKPPVYEPDNAIVSGGNLDISGGTDVLGDQGSIYANGDITVEGSSWVDQDAYAAGTVTGDDKIGGASAAGQPLVDIPDINPAAYQDLADYELRTNGDVYDVSVDPAVYIDTATDVDDVMGWTYDGSTWAGGAAVADGTYYVPGDKDVIISGSPGTVADPWVTTLLVTGNVIIDSQAVMTPDESGVSILARQDILISGGVVVQNGMIATHEQMSISGNVDIVGMVLSESAENISLLVDGSSEFNISAGTASITYSGELTTFLDYGDPYIQVKGIKRIK